LEANEKNTKKVLDSLDFYLKNTPAHIKGLIIDLRSNGGGDVVDLNFLFGKLIDKPLKIGSLKYKNGNGRFDYTPWVDATIYPQPGFKKFSLPIIVLVDAYSASLSEAFAMAAHLLPNGIILGERTWGATGPIADKSVYNYGGFKIGGGLNVTMAEGEFKYTDNKIYENVGFTPDIISVFDLIAYRSGHDLQLETAVSLLKVSVK
jgi:C-terminal processing protease CtpA/Prc